MLSLQAEEEALSEGLDIVDTMKMVLPDLLRQVAYINRYKVRIIMSAHKGYFAN